MPTGGVGPGGQWIGAEDQPASSANVTAGFVPPTNDYEGVISAIKQAINSVICKNVIFGDALYDLGSNYIPIISGIGYIGQPPRMEYDQTGWSDRNQRYIGGSRFTTTHDYTFWDGALDAGSTATQINAQSATFVAGSAEFTVSNGASWSVGRRLLFKTSACGFYAGLGYFVLSVSGNKLTVGLADKVAITATDSGTYASMVMSDRMAGTTSGVRMMGLCGVDSRTFIKTGARNAMGLAYSYVSHIYVRGREADRGTFNALRSISCTNFIQCDFHHIVTNDGDGQYWGADFPAAEYTPGNSVFTHLFNASNGTVSSPLFQKGITFQAEPGSILNQVTVLSAQHNTAVGTTVYQTTTGAQVSGQPDIAVADSSKFPVGAMVQNTTGVNGFEAAAMFFVVYSASNVIRLSNYKGHTARNLTGTSAMTLKTLGFPLFEVVGVGKDAGAGIVTYGEFRNLDLEGDCSAAFVGQNGQGVDVTINAAATPLVWSAIGRAWWGTLLAKRTGCTTEIDTDSRVIISGIRTSKASGDANYSPPGLRYDDRTGTWELKLTAVSKNSDFSGNFSADSGPTIRALTPLAINQAQFNGSKTFGNGNYDSGLVIRDGSGTDTYTLPVITDLAAPGSMVGMVWEIVNAGSNAMTVATQSGQLFNNITAKTSFSLPAGQSVHLRACRTAAPTARLFWHAVMSPALP